MRSQKGPWVTASVLVVCCPLMCYPKLGSLRQPPCVLSSPKTKDPGAAQLGGCGSGRLEVAVKVSAGQPHLKARPGLQGLS